MKAGDSNNRYRLVESLYQQAADLPRERRAGFLAHECDGDAELLREVETLLKHYEAADDSYLCPPPSGTIRIELPPGEGSRDRQSRPP